MEPGLLVKKIAKLPEDLKRKAEGYIDALLDEAENIANSKVASANRGYGSLKGKIWMSEDFNEPLEDFKDYM
jgi:hypothetical protein